MGMKSAPRGGMLFTRRGEVTSRISCRLRAVLRSAFRSPTVNDSVPTPADPRATEAGSIHAGYYPRLTLKRAEAVLRSSNESSWHAFIRHRRSVEEVLATTLGRWLGRLLAGPPRR